MSRWVNNDRQWMDVVGGMLYVWMDLYVLVYGCTDRGMDG